MSEKKKNQIEKISEIFPQTSTQDIEELLALYNDVSQVITILTQRSEEYSWTEVKKKKPLKTPTEQKQSRRSGKPRTDPRRNQNSNSNQNTTQHTPQIQQPTNPTTQQPGQPQNQTQNQIPNQTQNNPISKPTNATDSEAQKPRQTETNQDHQTQPYDGYRSYGRGRGRGGYPREGYGRGGGYNQTPNGAPRYPNQRYPNSYRGNRPYNQTAPYNQTTTYNQQAPYNTSAPNHQIESLNPPQIPVQSVEEVSKVSESPDEIYRTEPEVSVQDQGEEELNNSASQFNEAESSPSNSSSDRDTQSHSPAPSDSKISKTSPGQGLPPSHARVPKAPVQRWKVKESPSPTNVSSTANLQATDENTIPTSVPPHTQSPESDHPQEQIYVQHPPQSSQASSTLASTQTSTSSPQPSPEPLESESSQIGSQTANVSLQTGSHDQPVQTLSQTPTSQQNSSPHSSVSAHQAGPVPIQQVSQPAPTSPQAPLQQNSTARASKVVILPTGLRNEDQVAFKFGNIPMMYGESKPSLSEEHGLSLGDMPYKAGSQPHRDVHGLQDYHTSEPELQDPIAPVHYPYVPYVFPYIEDGSQDVQRMRMGVPYYDSYLGFRQPIDPKPYPVNRGSPISGSTYGSREKYHSDSSNPAQPNQNSNTLSQQPQPQAAQSPQIPQQQSQQAQQPPPAILPPYYNSPPVYGYSYFPGQYTYQGMPTTHYPYMGRNISYYKPTPGTYPNYPSNAYTPGAPLAYEDEYKSYMPYNPSFFAPEGLTGASISSSKTSPVGTGPAAGGQNAPHLGGASHVSKGQSAYASPNSPGNQTSVLGQEKPGSDYSKNYSPNAQRDTSFYQVAGAQMQYFQPTTYPARMVQPQQPQQHHQHHQHHHLHQPAIQPQGQPTPQSQGGQGQQSGLTQTPQQATGQQGQARPQSSQTQA